MRDPRKDLYAILGVDKDASTESIRRAFRARALELHPDKQTGADDKARYDAEIRFKELNEAYRVLSDPKSRRMYDNPEQTFEELLRTVFGGSGASFVVIDDELDDTLGATLHGLPVPSAKAVVVPITLAEVCTGCSDKQVQFKLARPCGPCKGTGAADPASGIMRCMACGGGGTLLPGIPLMCTACAGRGSMLKQGCRHCTVCNGDGTIWDEHTVTVQVPCGVRPGAALHPVTQQLPQLPVSFVAQYVLDGNTSVQELHVHVQVDVGLVELLCGFRRELDMCGTRRVLVSRGYFDVSRPKCIKGAGLPHPRHPKDKNRAGNLYIHWVLHLPATAEPDGATLRAARKALRKSLNRFHS